MSSRIVSEYDGENFAVKLLDEGEKYILIWTDTVIQAWEEDFTLLSTALVRYAALVRCAERGFYLGFDDGSEPFDDVVDRFFTAILG